MQQNETKEEQKKNINILDEEFEVYEEGKDDDKSFREDKKINTDYYD